MLVWFGATFKIMSQYLKGKGNRRAHKLLCLTELTGERGLVEKGASAGTNETCRDMPSPALLKI